MLSLPIKLLLSSLVVIIVIGAIGQAIITFVINPGKKRNVS